MAKQNTKTPDEMSFLDHLEELRWHLIRSTIAVVIIGSVAFLMKSFIFDTVIFGPSKIRRSSPNRIEKSKGLHPYGYIYVKTWQGLFIGHSGVS